LSFPDRGFQPLDRLSKITNASTSLTYGWRADGLRGWKQLANRTKLYFLYDGDAPVCEIEPHGAAVAVNTWGPTGLSGRYTNSSTYYGFDARGSVAQTVNAAGTVLNTFSFDGYGKANGTAATDPYSGYGGEWGYYTDTETGLVLCGLRFYDANQARFINRDPIGQEGGANLYQYVQGSPLMGADPSGLTEIWDLVFLALDAFNVVSDAATDAPDSVKRIDEAALTIDGALAMIPGVPTGGGHFGLQASREVALAVAQVPQVVRDGQILWHGARTLANFASSGGSSGSDPTSGTEHCTEKPTGWIAKDLYHKMGEVQSILEARRLQAPCQPTTTGWERASVRHRWRVGDENRRTDGRL
jgi:RHS repeat-associated protein